MEKYKTMLTEMFTSKKFHGLVAGITTVLSNDPVPGPAMSEKSVGAIVLLIVGWMYAQGQSDKGKAVAKIEAEAKLKASTVPAE